MYADPRGELPHRSEAHHHQGSAIRYVGALDALPRRGEDVAQEKVPVVRQVGIDLDVVVVGKRNTEDVTGVQVWPEQLVEVQIGAADRVPAR